MIWRPVPENLIVINYRVLEKISGNLECYLESLETNEVLHANEV